VIILSHNIITDLKLWSVQTFNEFFIRELKPDSRPIVSAERDDIAVCAADCRLSAFKSVDDSKRFWIKVLHLFLTTLEYGRLLISMMQFVLNILQSNFKIS